MSALQDWLEQATRGLSVESADQVRAEIEEHFEAAREAAIISGASLAEAHRQECTRDKDHYRNLQVAAPQ